jgi:hypothetical protein
VQQFRLYAATRTDMETEITPEKTVKTRLQSLHTGQTFTKVKRTRNNAGTKAIIPVTTALC